MERIKKTQIKFLDKNDNVWVVLDGTTSNLDTAEGKTSALEG